MTIIIYDTETTGLLAPMAASIDYQPYLVELYCIKFDMNMERLDSLHVRCKPPISIPPDATKIHGITDADVSECRSFAYYLSSIAELFTGCRIMVGHNENFDKMIIYYELLRIGKQLNFPWAMHSICTAEWSRVTLGIRMTLTDLHTYLFGEGFTGAHSASVDCEMTAKCYVELTKRGMV